MEPIKKQLTLIQPPVTNPFLRIASNLQQGQHIPYALHILAALTPKDYTIKFIPKYSFLRQEKIVPGTLVAITCLTATADNAYRIADYYRKGGAIVVMGGIHVTMLPDEAIEHCHSVVIGEGESAWPEVIRDFEAGTLKKKYFGQQLEDFFSPVFDYFMRLPPAQLRPIGIIAQRGCKFHCGFCAMPQVRIRSVKVEQVVALMKRASEGTFFKPRLMLIGDNIYLDPEYTKSLFRALKGANVKFHTGSSLDVAFDDELLALAKEAGCQFLMIGFESINPKQFAKTSTNQIKTSRDYTLAINRIKKHGLGVIGLFIAGLDEYTHRDYLKLLLFLARPGQFLMASVNMLTPFPGTALREQFIKEGRLDLKAGWAKHDLISLLFKPANGLSRWSLVAWHITTKMTAVLMSRVGLMMILGYVGLYSATFWYTTARLQEAEKKSTKTVHFNKPFPKYQK